MAYFKFANKIRLGETIQIYNHGDMYQTYADTTELERDFDFKPKTTIEEGLGKFAKWYKEYYRM